MIRRRPTDRDGGFTLVELLVAVVIEALVVGALGRAFVGILNGTNSVNQSLSRSGDARIAAAYIISDAAQFERARGVAHVVDVHRPEPAGRGHFDARRAVRLARNDERNGEATTTHVVDYILVSNSLLRRECKGGVLVSDRVVARSVLGVVVVCSPTANCTGSPTSITATVTADARLFRCELHLRVLTGTFRKLIGGGPPFTGGLILLGDGKCGPAAGINLSGSGWTARVLRRRVPQYPRTMGANCGAITLDGGAAYQAGTTSALNGGTCQAPAYLLVTCPSPIAHYATPKPDPYAKLTPPSTAGRPAQVASTQCQSPNSTAQPGVYASQLVVTSSNSCQLASGVYILQAGIAVSGNLTLSSAPDGVLIYITGGSFTVGNSGGVNIAAQTSGPWARSRRVAGQVGYQPARVLGRLAGHARRHCLCTYGNGERLGQRRRTRSSRGSLRSRL